MTAGPVRTAIPVLAILVFAALLGWFFSRERETAPPSGSPTVQNTGRPADTPGQRAGSDDVSGGRAPVADLERAPLGERLSSADPNAPAASSTAGGPKTGRDGEGALPSFDVVRVEPTGESVIAGRAAPNATVELLRNGEPLARVVADASGLFAIVPPALPPGSHEIVLQVVGGEGAGARSAQSVTVVIGTARNEPPLVTVSAPNQPTIILSRPDAPAGSIATAPGGSAQPRQAGTGQAGTGQPSVGRPDLRIATVEAAGDGRLFVSGQAAPRATIRLYLNDAFVAPAATGPDGRLSFSIERGIRPGDYRVRLDDVDPVTGAVKSRVEVPFNVPQPAVVAARGVPPIAGSDAPRSAPTPGSRSAANMAPGTQAGTASSARPGSAGSTVPSGSRQEAGAGSPASPGGATAQSVVVPEVNTAIVARGDNLWRISKRIYGDGVRYTVIYGANLPQIRNPNLIYPGQLFVLPAGDAGAR